MKYETLELLRYEVVFKCVFGMLNSFKRSIRKFNLSNQDL